MAKKVTVIGDVLGPSRVMLAHAWMILCFPPPPPQLSHQGGRVEPAPYLIRGWGGDSGNSLSGNDICCLGRKQKESNS